MVKMKLVTLGETMIDDRAKTPVVMLADASSWTLLDTWRWMERVRLGATLDDEEGKTAVVAEVLFFTLFDILGKMELVTLGETLIDERAKTPVVMLANASSWKLVDKLREMERVTLGVSLDDEEAKTTTVAEVPFFTLVDILGKIELIT